MNKSSNISYKQLLVLLGAIAYIIFCFVFDVHKGVTFYQNSSRHINKSNKDSKPTLALEKGVYLDNEILSVKNQVVVIDTIIYKVDRTKEGSFLIGRVVCDNENRFMVKLAFDEDDEEYASLLFRKVRLKAIINRIYSIPYEKEIYTFDNALVWHKLNYDYILEGNLEEILAEFPVNG